MVQNITEKVVNRLVQVTSAMKQEQSGPQPQTDEAERAADSTARGERLHGDQRPKAASKESPKEVGGPSGPEPTRYGDWERAGRCIDF